MEKARYQWLREIAEKCDGATNDGDRDRIVMEVCGDDAGLRRQVKEFLAYREEVEAEGFLERTIDSESNAQIGNLKSKRIVWGEGDEPLEGYILLEFIGEGGQGEVWKVERKAKGIELALKRVFLDEPIGQKELRNLKPISVIRHPNLLTVFDYFVSEKELLIVTDLADCTLQDVLRANPTGVDVDVLLGFISNAADGLGALHEKNIVHRDIKPGNLLVVGDGLKIGDVGLAKVLEKSSDTHSGGWSWGYAAPEFFSNKCSARSDQYSLAVTYFTLRTGKHIFEDYTGSPLQIKEAHCHLPVRERLRELPDKEAEVLAKALSKTPEERFKSCGQFVQELRRARQKTGATGSTKVLEEPIAGVDEFVRRQQRWLLNLPILPWGPEKSPSVNFIWPNLIVAPHVVPQKHQKRPLPFVEWMREYDWASHIALVGAPGIGKSTILRTMVFEFGKDLGERKQIPILTTASDMLEFKHSGDESFVKFVARRYRVLISEEELGRRGIILLVDGLDEINASDLSTVMTGIGETVDDNSLLWIACRNAFFFQRIASNDSWMGMFFEVLELPQWDVYKDALPFVYRYGQCIDEPTLEDRVNSLVERYPETKAFLRTPFEIVLLLYLLTYPDQVLSASTFRNSYSLYAEFYKNWLGRERHRGTSNLSRKEVGKLHRQVGLLLYQRRGHAIDINELLDQLNAEISVEDIVADSAFCGLLILRSYGDESDLSIQRFLHETLAEFLIADDILLAFLEGREILRRRLTTVYHYDVNAFVRGGLECMSEADREAVLRNLQRAYFDAFWIGGDQSDYSIQLPGEGNIDRALVNRTKEATRIRGQVLYYIGRLSLDDMPRILEWSFKNEPVSFLRRSAALGAMLYGDEEIETEYIKSLTPESDEDIENRSIQLVYFDDVQSDIYSFRDDRICDWKKTRSAIYERLTRSSRRELNLRWWDLRTLRLFYISRNWCMDSETDCIGFIENTSIDSLTYSRRKKEMLAKEKEALLRKLRRRGRE